PAVAQAVPAAEAPIIAALEPEIISADLVVADPERSVAVPAIASSPARFEMAVWQPDHAPAVEALVAAAPATMRFLTAETPRLNFAALPTMSPPAAIAPAVPEVLSADAYLAVLEARQWQRKAGLWREDVVPAWRDG